MMGFNSKFKDYMPYKASKYQDRVDHCRLFFVHLGHDRVSDQIYRKLVCRADSR